MRSARRASPATGACLLPAEPGRAAPLIYRPSAGRDGLQVVIILDQGENLAPVQLGKIQVQQDNIRTRGLRMRTLGAAGSAWPPRRPMSPVSSPRARGPHGAVTDIGRRVHLMKQRAATGIAVACALRRIQGEQLAHHAVGPAKTILKRILAAAATAANRDDIVFLDQFAALAVDVLDVTHPAAGDALRQIVLAV